MVIDIGTLYATQISLTEWLEQIKHPLSQKIRQDDNNKRERMATIRSIIPFPFDQPVEMMATDIAEHSPAYENFLQNQGEMLCALRLIPLDDSLPKLRLRGRKAREMESWFREQDINPSQYKAHFVSHAESYEWSTIFVVGEEGIVGEIIPGGHYQLTQGFHEQDKPLVFRFDFQNWFLPAGNETAVEHLKAIVSHLKVGREAQRQLAEAVQATFSKGYLQGYFETVFSAEHGLWFIDYNPLLGERVLQGINASGGKVRGIARITMENFHEGDILIKKMTTPDDLPLMQKAAAIVTQQGGMLTHAAIVARELRKPCLTGVENLFILVKDGDLIEVDADAGTLSFPKLL